MDLINTTPLTTASHILTDRNGADTLVVIVKGTWRIEKDGLLSVAEEQVPVRLEPTYASNPTASSLVYDTDIVLEKPGTDCILLGHAWAPKPGVGSVDVTFAVGPVRKQVTVFSDRIWMKCFGKISISRPVPFEKIPLVWERAFGGSDTSWHDPAGHEFSLENPVGRGLLAEKSRLKLDGLRLPNIEDPAKLINAPTDRPHPMGFGPIPPHWHPRAGYAGAYDEHWRKFVCPLPPEDMDLRFNSSASAGLMSKTHLSGSEQVLVENASQAGRLLFDLPGVAPNVSALIGPTDLELEMRLDTIIVEPDKDRVTLTWRGTLPVHNKLHQIMRVKVSNRSTG